MSLNERSKKNLVGVHPDLVRVVERAAEISPEPFVVTEGLRNLERQKKLLAAGKSKTLDSRHLTGHAVDLVDADDFKYDEPDMERIADAMKKAAAIEKVPIEWGPDMWGWDSPHFQLPKNVYPASGLTLATKAKQATVKAVTSKPAVAVGTGVATKIAVDSPAIPAPPDLTPYSGWKDFGVELGGLWSFAWQNVALTVILLLILAALYFLPKVKQ